MIGMAPPGNDPVSDAELQKSIIVKEDGPVKSRFTNDFVKSSKCKARNQNKV